jgi:hypothetical protein
MNGLVTFSTLRKKENVRRKDFTTKATKRHEGKRKKTRNKKQKGRNKRVAGVRYFLKEME